MKSTEVEEPMIFCQEISPRLLTIFITVILYRYLQLIFVNYFFIAVLSLFLWLVMILAWPWVTSARTVEKHDGTEGGQQKDPSHGPAVSYMQLRESTTGAKHESKILRSRDLRR